MGDIFKERKRWLAVSADSNSIKRNRASEWPVLENALATWIDYANKSNYTITTKTRFLLYRKYSKFT